MATFPLAPSSLVSLFSFASNLDSFSSIARCLLHNFGNGVCRSSVICKETSILNSHFKLLAFISPSRITLASVMRSMVIFLFISFVSCLPPPSPHPHFSLGVNLAKFCSFQGKIICVACSSLEVLHEGNMIFFSFFLLTSYLCICLVYGTIPKMSHISIFIVIFFGIFPFYRLLCFVGVSCFLCSLSCV